ncbi:hypothetical protein LWI28_021267 [Acer negundo]|uniref:Exocyst subunit Exo70 family protein n=1 Tax=Acer negundo TaxID=4023 RepID=A0AAD5JF38_ACENE|nr:hypothetical protein LWI28_021267 [Acer negundo]KAK4852393.1 hypothetical protein QYF36_023589 [Acer negundo]
MFFKSPSPSTSRTATPSSSPPHRHTFSESLMEENILIAQSIITKWDVHSSIHACNIESLFSATNNRQEAKQFIKSVNDLQSAMHYFVSHHSGSQKLVQAQNLMQTAMKRLEKELYQMLKANRDYLDAESISNHSSTTLSSRASRASLSDMEEDSEDEVRSTDDLVSENMERPSVSMIAMADLKSIVDCMISAGYAKECVKIYKISRKSIIDEAIYHHGVEKLSFSLIQKMDWEAVEIKIKHWLHAVKVAVKTLFYGERILCDYVFSVSDSIRESCFAEISKEAAMTLFAFPENVAKCKKTPEKMFRTLDLYEAVSDLWPEIESIFGFESTSDVRSQAVNSMIRLGDAVRTMLTDFELAIQKDTSKTPIPGGGVHPLTRYVMNYLTFLADYSGSLTDIIGDSPLPTNSPLPETYYASPKKDDDLSSPVSMRIAWLILVLLCKLDSRAELYKDVALSYLFFANNLQYIVTKVRTSNLRFLLGEDWVAKHDIKVRQYAANYERYGWSKVFASLPENPAVAAEMPIEQVRNGFRLFNLSFEDAYKKQSSWVVLDPKLRDEIKVSLARKIVPVYREFYELNRNSVLRSQPGNENLVRYVPDDLGNYLSDLFYGPAAGGSVSGSVSSNSTPSHSSRGSHYGRSR